MARLIADVTGFSGSIEFDSAKPDGTLRKLMDVSRLKGMGWVARTGLRKGLEETYAWFRNLDELREALVPYSGD